MSDEPLFRPDDRVEDVEALLAELDATDLAVTPPPSDVWEGIEAALADDAGEADAQVTALSDRRSRFSTRFLAAAATIAALMIGTVVVSSLRGDDADVVAEVDMAFDPAAFDPLGSDAAATARLVERDGGFEIRLVDASLPDPGSDDLELWLIAVGTDGSLDVQPVALVDPTSPGVYAVPDDLDPGVYSTVDISVEPRDGDETHSGRSILRGTLTDV